MAQSKQHQEAWPKVQAIGEKITWQGFDVLAKRQQRFRKAPQRESLAAFVESRELLGKKVS